MDVFTSNLMNLCYLMLSLNVINLVRVLFAKSSSNFHLFLWTTATDISSTEGNNMPRKPIDPVISI